MQFGVVPAARPSLLGKGDAAHITWPLPLIVEKGRSFDDVERTVRDCLRQIGGQAMQLFVTLQGDGDVGEELTTDQGETLRRSDQKHNAKIRSIDQRTTVSVAIEIIRVGTIGCRIHRFSVWRTFYSTRLRIVAFRGPDVHARAYPLTRAQVLNLTFQSRSRITMRIFAFDGV